MSFTRKALLATLLCTATVACGEASKSGLEGIDSEDVGIRTLAGYRLAQGEYGVKSHRAECNALFIKLNANRNTLRLQSEWGTIAATDAYKSLEAKHGQFRDEDCKVTSTAPSANCQRLETELEELAKAVEATPQWQTLDNSSPWKNLRDDVRSAQKINCL